MKEIYKDTTCDWCNRTHVNVTMHRDVDEGFGGPEYMVCFTCIKKENDRAEEELNNMNPFERMTFDNFWMNYED